MTTCFDIIYSQDLPGLVEWLKEDSANRWGDVLATVRIHAHKSSKIAGFFCENIRFFATGKSYDTKKELSDEDAASRIAEGLGHCTVRSPSEDSSSFTEDAKNTPGHRSEDIINILKSACNKVDPSLAFSATTEVLRLLPQHTEEALILLDGIIQKCPDKPQRITSASAVISQVFEKNHKLMPFVSFLRAMWSMEVDDAHNVCKCSLLSLVFRMHTSIVRGHANFKERDAGLMLCNLVCCWERDICSWVMRMCLYTSQPDLGILDHSPLDEALCCYRILTDKASLMPRIYSIDCLVGIHLKVAKVIAANIKNGSDSNFERLLTLQELAVELLQKSGQYEEYTTSPPKELLAMLFGLCSKKGNIQRSTEILKFFIQIAAEHSLAAMCDAIFPKCASDAAMSHCLAAFLDRFAVCGEATQQSAISTLRAVSKRMEADVQSFSMSLECLVTWLRNVSTQSSKDSVLSKSANDLYHSLTGSLLSNQTNE